MSTPAHWAFVARECAKKAYRLRDSSERGLMLVEGDAVLVFYDNRSPVGSMRLRERVVAKFRSLLAGVEIAVLATATYPHHGPDDGRTLAVVLDAGEAEKDTVAAVWDLACRATPPREGEQR